MEASSTDHAIKTFALLRKIFWLLAFLIIVVALGVNIYRQIHNWFWIDSLHLIAKKGISKPAHVESEYEIKRVNYGTPTLTFQYAFQEDGELYENEYSFVGYLPSDTAVLKALFTVHYLKDSPDQNTLNLDYEIQRVSQENAEASVWWLIIKIIFLILALLIFFVLAYSFVHFMKTFSEPIEIPEYQKK